VTQVLNFGIAAPIDVQIEGAPATSPRTSPWPADRRPRSPACPARPTSAWSRCPDVPTLLMNVDRDAGQLRRPDPARRGQRHAGLALRHGPAEPQLLGGPTTNVQYSVLVQTPQYQIDSINALQEPAGHPLARWCPARPLDPRPSSSAASRPSTAGTSASQHHPLQPAADLRRPGRGARHGPELRRQGRPQDRRQGVQEPAQGHPKINIRGQVQSMDESFQGLSYGLIFAIVLVYLLLVVNFQSWLDPLIILMALPGRPLRHPLDALHHPDDDQRAVADGRHHEHRRRDRQQHPDDHLRQRPAEGGA
jgi:hypothetical protein